MLFESTHLPDFLVILRYTPANENQPLVEQSSDAKCIAMIKLDERSLEEIHNDFTTLVWEGFSHFFRMVEINASVSIKKEEVMDIDIFVVDVDVFGY